MPGVPYAFGNATTTIPLSQLDNNFNTVLTIGATGIGLGNTTPNLANVTLVTCDLGTPTAGNLVNCTGIPAGAVGANPTAAFTGAAINGSAGTFMRSDAAPAIGTLTANLIFTDATYDIGASGATRPRNIFLSGNATASGAVAATTVQASFAFPMIMGAPSSSYGSVGYNANPAGTNAWTYKITDTAYWIQYGSGGQIQFFSAISGSAGAAISPIQIMALGATLAGSGSRAVLADSVGLLSAPVSNEDFKENWSPIDGLGMARALKIGWFDWKKEHQASQGAFRDFGMGAQTAAKVGGPALAGQDNGNWYANRDKAGIIALAAVIQLEDMIESLEARIAALEAK